MIGGTTRLNLVVSSSSVIVHQLRWYGFRRLVLKVRVADSALALLRMIDQEAPDALITETGLPDGDGFAVAKAVKVDRGLSRTAVILLAEAGISQDVASAIVNSRCDQLLVTPLLPGQLYESLAELFDLPRRLQARISVRASVSAKVMGEEIPSRLVDLTPSGARVRLASQPPRTSSLNLRLRSGAGASFSVEAKIVWQKAYEKGVELALKFPDVTPEQREQLRGMLTWEVQDRAPGQLVRILVDITDRMELEGLKDQLTGPVEFDLSQVNRLNSVGVSRWIRFLDSLPGALSYRFSHCSTSFAEQAAYVPALLGKGAIISLFAPFFCAECDVEVEREVTAEAALAGPVEPTCTCGRALTFDGDARRFFASLGP